MHFKTREVAELHEHLKGWGHPDHPFLDPEYSPGSLAPATDLTPFFATWIAEGKHEAIRELWSFITIGSEASVYGLQKALSYSLPAGITVADWQWRELRAINALSLRCALIHGPRDIAEISRLLVATTLACERIAIDPTAQKTLIRATKPEIREGSPCDVTRGPAGAADFSVEKLQLDTLKFDSVSARLKLVPPIARMVLHDYLKRNWAQGRLRLSLYYGERMYGCSSGWNSHYLTWTDFFMPVSDDDEVPSAVTKDVLKEALTHASVEFKKSESRVSLIGRARPISGLISNLLVRYAPEQRTLRPEWKEPVKDWSDRVHAIGAACAGIIKLMTLGKAR